MSAGVGTRPGDADAATSLAPIVISRGSAINRTSAQRISCERTAEALAALLDTCSTPHDGSAWWSTAVWSGDTRTKTDETWLHADCVAIDVDHAEDRRLTRDERLELHALRPSLPGSVYYDSPKGFRAVAILAERNRSAELQDAAQLGLAALTAAALTPLPWLQIDQGVAADARGRALYPPRGNPKPDKEPRPRDARCVVLREELFSAATLAAAAPPPPPKPVPTTGAPNTPTVGASRPKRASDEFDDAVRAWNFAHPREYATPGRECPMCGHRGCFGALPAAPERWHCFSSNHLPDVGRPAPSGMGYTGDALDLAAFERRRTRVEVLRDDGYLAITSFDARVHSGHGANPSAIVVRDIDEAQTHICQALQDWRVGDRSLEIAGAAGSGKTTAAIRDLLRRLRARGIQVGILAMHTAALVREKADQARDLIGDDSIESVELLGSRPDATHGFWCEEPERRAASAELGLFACSGCPLLEDATCENTPQRYRHDSLAALARIKCGAAALVLTTHARLPQLIEELRDAGLHERSAIVVDDDGSPCGGLLRDTEIDPDTLESAHSHIGDHLARTRANLVVARRAWDSWFARFVATRCVPSESALLRQQQPYAPIADAVHCVLSAILATATADDGRPVAESQPFAAVAANLRSQHPVFANALAASSVPGSPWTWEWHLPDDGPDRRPAMTRELLRLLAIELAGHSITVVPVVRNPRRRHVVAWRFRAACLPLARAAANGRVCFLSVGPLPRAAVEWLRIRSALLEAEPAMLTTLQVRSYLFGTRQPQPALVLAIWTALVNAAARPGGIKFVGTTYAAPAAILRKRDRGQLKATHPAAYEASGHYGRAHAATDAFANRDLLFVSRTSLPPGVSQATARALAAAFPAIIAQAPDRGAALDALADDLQTSWRRQHMLNAVGRLRALSANRLKLVVVADGEKVPGLFVDEEWTLAELITEFQLDGAAIREAVAAVDAARQRSDSERAEAHATDDAAADLYRVVLRTAAEDIAAEWWQLRHAPITAYDLGVILAGRGHALTRADLRELRGELAERVAQFGAETSSISTRAHSGAELSLSDLPTAVSLASRAGVSSSTAKRFLAELRSWLGGGPPPTLGRSDRAATWLACARAIRQLMIESGTWDAVAGHPFAELAEDGAGGAQSSSDKGPPPGSGRRPEPHGAAKPQAPCRSARSRRPAALVADVNDAEHAGFSGACRRADDAGSSVQLASAPRLGGHALDSDVAGPTGIDPESSTDVRHRAAEAAPSRGGRSQASDSSTPRTRGYRPPHLRSRTGPSPTKGPRQGTSSRGLAHTYHPGTANSHTRSRRHPH